MPPTSVLHRPEAVLEGRVPEPNFNQKPSLPILTESTTPTTYFVGSLISDLPVDEPIELSVVIPCLNEAKTLAICIRKAFSAMRAMGVHGEVVVADNGSTDGSQAIARNESARLIEVAERGYGSAVRGAVTAARGRYIIMGDADDSYDFTQLRPFLACMQEGAELVMGNRFRGGIADGSMPFLNRYLGNPVLSGLGRLFFKSRCGDFHCGMRGFSKEAFERMQLRTSGMEFASEMVVKATLSNMTIAEVPTPLHPAGRDRKPHLRPWRDGWRHLRFLLMYSPNWLFFYPGMAMIAVCLGVIAWLLPQSRHLGGITLSIHTMIYATAGVLVGYQSVLFAVFAKVFAITSGMLPDRGRFMRWCEVFTLEIGLAAGALIMLIGICGAFWALAIWYQLAFGNLEVQYVGRIVTISAMSLALGVQTVLASFFLSLLNVKRD